MLRRHPIAFAYLFALASGARWRFSCGRSRSLAALRAPAQPSRYGR